MGDSKPDVQMLCHQIVAKVSEYSPGGVLGSLDALIEPLEKTCNKQVRACVSIRLRKSVVNTTNCPSVVVSFLTWKRFKTGGDFTLADHALPLCLCTHFRADIQVKAEQVGTEVERANDLIRSALRCVVAISRVDDVGVSGDANNILGRQSLFAFISYCLLSLTSTI